MVLHRDMNAREWFSPENEDLYSNSIYKGLECKEIVSKIIEKLYETTNSNDWNNSYKRSEKTKLIKNALANLAGKMKYRVNAHDLTNETVDNLKRCEGINEHYYPNREWLLDMVWSTENEDSKYEIKKVILGMECEWGFKRKYDSDVYGHVKYDFLKLIVVEARLSVMIFRWRAEDDNRIGQDDLTKYFVSVVNGYEGGLCNNILCIGFKNDYKSFVYRFFQKKSR